MDISSYKRDYINILRGLAIFLMLWGHSIQHASNGYFDFYEDDVFKFIYSFHMPLFMMVSGYLFRGTCKKMDLLELLKHKTRALFHPLVMCTIINYYITTGVSCVIRGGYSDLFNGGWLENIKSLWFLWSVLAFSISLGVAVKITSIRWLQILLVLIGWFAAAIFPGADGNIYLYPYFVFGYYLANYEFKFEKRILIVGLISLLVFAILLMNFHKEHYIYISGIIGNGYAFKEHLMINLLRWAVGFAGCISCIVISSAIYQRVHNKLLANPVLRGVENLGIYSLEVYALSVSLLSAYLPSISRLILINILRIDLVEYKAIYDFVITPLIAIAYSFGLYWLARLLYRIHAGEYVFGTGRKIRV